MHMRGEPRNMHTLTYYKDILQELKTFFSSSIKKLDLPRKKIILDPGIGFSKTFEQNCFLLKNLSILKDLSYSLLVGVSRKSFIDKIINEAIPEKRLWGTAASCAIAIYNGANILRVHDIKEIKQVSQVAFKLKNITLQV